MGERLREAPRPSVRYSRSIPPERRGKTSGVYRIDIKKKVMLVNTHEIIGRMPGIQRKEWFNGGVLLKTFDAWKLLPTEITERDTEQRRDILAFIAGEKRTPHGAKEYGELPSLEAISIEIARLVIENIPEWNALQPTVQFIIEPEIIRLINQDHKEFMDLEKAVKEFNANINPLERLERNYDAGVPSNYVEMEREAKQKILAKIVQKIGELAASYASENDDEIPDQEELCALAGHTSSAVGKILEDQKRTALRPPPDAGNTPTIPASPRGKRKSTRK
jgi:hypothetical protein